MTAASRHGLSIDERHHPRERGFEGETLSVDNVLLGREGARDLIVLTSGVHGAEGFCGSGCQIALLSDDELMKRVTEGPHGLLLIHAVNPHGFSWWRRVNEDYIDLNRNFLDFSKPLPENPLYPKIHPLLIPSRWPPGALTIAKFAAMYLRHGKDDIQAALSQGQHEFPGGLFYSGRDPAWSNGTLRDIMREYGAQRRRMLWLDVHTGLGESGQCEKINIDRDNREHLRTAREIWGSEVTSMYDGSSMSARLFGLVFEAVYDECPDVDYAGVALEYGTLSPFSMLKRMCGDAWLHSHPEAPEKLRRQLRQDTRDAFYVDEDSWKRSIWAEARRSVNQALDWLDKNESVKDRQTTNRRSP